MAWPEGISWAWISSAVISSVISSAVFDEASISSPSSFEQSVP
jgi:hypothetical protein